MTRSVFTGRYRKLRELLRVVRKESRVTQAELSRRLNKPQSYVSKVEKGERRLDVIEFLDILGALNVSPSAFLKRMGAPWF